MNKPTNWSASRQTPALEQGIIEIQDKNGEFHDFYVILTNRKVIFGGVCNTGFIESGYMARESHETKSDSLGELLAELETYYNDGKQYTSRIICNERM